MSGLAAQLEAARQKLEKEERRGAEAEGVLASGQGDIEKAAEAVAKSEEAARPLRNAVAALERAKAAADKAAAEDRKRAEDAALEAELRPLDAATASALRDVEKHAGPLSDALSRAFTADLVAGRIRARLGGAPASTLSGDLNDLLRRLHLAAVEKHGDANGRGVASHSIEVPVFTVEVNAPTARRLGIV